HEVLRQGRRRQDSRQVRPGTPETSGAGRLRPDLFYVLTSSEERPRRQVYAVCASLTARRVSKDGPRASWFETAQTRLLTTRDKYSSLPRLHRSRGGAVAPDQVGDIEAGDRAIGHHPVAGDHDALGPM